MRFGRGKHHACRLGNHRSHKRGSTGERGYSSIEVDDEDIERRSILLHMKQDGPINRENEQDEDGEDQSY